MKKTFCLFMCLIMGIGLVAAQTSKVSGTVISADDKLPVIGASVMAKGTNIGTVTDVDGKFELSLPASAKTLEFSYVGMEKQEAAAQPVMNITLKSGSQKLNEVVVTALGISREKKALGFASTSIKGGDISNTQKVNPMAALQGKVAGLEVSSAPGPGATQNVMIRGTSTFGNNQPLYIIDGVPMTNDQNRGTDSKRVVGGDNLNDQVDFGSGINALNPNDIADMTVLKGAAATALYGSRAANGVIMITTKSGKNTDGKVQVQYDGGFSLSRVGFLPKEQKQFGQGWSGDRALDENGSWGPAFDGKDRAWGWAVDGDQQVKPYVYLKDRIRDFYDTGIGYKNGISLSGGTEKTNYFVSFSQNHTDGVIPTDADAYNRYTIGTRGGHKAGIVTISSSVNFSTEKTRAVASGQQESVFRSLLEIPTDISVTGLKDYKSKFNNLDNYFTPYSLNPYYVLNENGAVENRQKVFGKVQLDIDIMPELKLTYRFGGDYETSRAESHTAIVSYPDNANNAGSSAANSGKYEEMRRERVQLNHDAFANYHNRFFNDVFSLNAIVGLNINERSYNWLSGSVTSIDVPDYYNLINSLSPSVSKQYDESQRLIGAYANVDFGYKDYLYLTVTARNDWSSTLHPDNRSYFYPGATLSFLLTDFLHQQNIKTGVLDFAKLRVAYGKTGKDADPYAIYDRFELGKSDFPGYPNIDDLSFPLGGVNSYSMSNRLGNPDLKPELTKEFEVGTEINLFDHRVGVDFSYYNKFTKGLIASLPRDPSTGYTSMYSNLGDIRNKGFELTVNLVPLKLKDFTWSLSWNFTKNKNMVEKLDVDETVLAGFSGVSIYAVEGMPIGQFKVNKARTVDVNGTEAIVVDGSGNPLQTADPVYLNKDVNEKYRMGWTNTFDWRGLSLSATFDFRYGGYMYSNTKDYMHWPGTAPETVMNGREPFIIPNSVIQNPNGDGTYVENTTPVDPTQLHTFYSNGGLEGAAYSIIDRSYLKLRDVSLSYQFPKTVYEKLRLRGLRAAVNVSNILLWTPKENQYIDPEMTTFGNNINAKFGEFSGSPTTQTYTFGLNATF